MNKNQTNKVFLSVFRAVSTFSLLFLFFFVIHLKESEGNTILVAILAGLFMSISTWKDMWILKRGLAVFFILGICISFFSIEVPMQTQTTLSDIILLKVPNQGWWDLWFGYIFLFASIFSISALFISKLYIGKNNQEG